MLNSADLSSQPRQKPAAAEDGSGFREENDFHQQHSKDWVSHHPHRSHFPTSPSGESSSGASGEGPGPESVDGWKVSPAKSPPCLGPLAQLRTGPPPISGELARLWYWGSLCHRTEGLGDPRPRVHTGKASFGQTSLTHRNPACSPCREEGVKVGSFLPPQTANGKHPRWDLLVPYAVFCKKN